MVGGVSSALPSVSEKPRFVAKMFGRIARRYDLMNTLMTAGQDQKWRRLVANSVLSTQYSVLSVLDVGTGTGKLASAIEDAAPSSRVVGVDFTEGMLRVAPRQLL